MKGNSSINPYNTHITKAYDMSRTANVLTQVDGSWATRDILNIETFNNGFFNTGAFSNFRIITDLTVPEPREFRHPYLLKRSHTEIPTVFVDLRNSTSATRESRNANKVIIKDGELLSYQLILGALYSISVQGEREQLIALGELPTVAYMNWLGNAVVNGLGFTRDYEKATKIKVVCAAFYHHILDDEEDFADSKLRIARRIARHTRVPETLINETMDSLNAVKDELGSFDTMEDLITAIKAIGEDPRMDKLNGAYIQQLLVNTWRLKGDNEQVLVAIERPETFLAIVYNLMTGYSNRKSMLMRAIEGSRLGNRDIENFNKSLMALIANN